MKKRCPKTFQLLWNQKSNTLCIIDTLARTIFSVQNYDKEFKVPPSSLTLDFRFATSSLSTAAGWVEGFPSKIFIVLRRPVARLLVCIMRSQVKWLVAGQVIGAIRLLLHTAALALQSPLLQQFVPHRDFASHSWQCKQPMPHTPSSFSYFLGWCGPSCGTALSRLPYSTYLYLDFHLCSMIKLKNTAGKSAGVDKVGVCTTGAPFCSFLCSIRIVPMFLPTYSSPSRCLDIQIVG